MTEANEKGCMICDHTAKEPYGGRDCTFCEHPRKRRLETPPLHFNLSSRQKIVPPKRTKRTTVWRFEVYVDGHYFGRSEMNFFTIEQALEGIGLLLAKWPDIKHVPKDHGQEYLKLDIESGDRLFQSRPTNTCVAEGMMYTFVDEYLKLSTVENVPYSSKYLISVEAHWGRA